MLHCFNHRLVVASRAGQQHIPRDGEDTISDILKYSAVYTSGFKRYWSLLKTDTEGLLPTTRMVVNVSML